MSLLIKGIEMPKESWECPCHNGENGSCNVTQKVCFEIPKDCPLVEVSIPHGDLIDKEDLKLSIEHYHGRFRFVNESPVVIESEER